MSYPGGYMYSGSQQSMARRVGGVTTPSRGGYFYSGSPGSMAHRAPTYVPRVFPTAHTQTPYKPGFGKDPGARDDAAAAAANPQGSDIPEAGAYLEQQAQALKAYNDALAQIETQKSGLRHQYGLNAQNGIDLNSNFGLIQQMNQAHGQDVGNMEQDYVDRGIDASSGIARQGYMDTLNDYGNQSNQLSQNFLSSLGGLNSQGEAAGHDYQQALINAKKDAIARAIQNKEFTPALYKYLYGNEGG